MWEIKSLKQWKSNNCMLYIYIYIYTLGQQHKTILQNEEKDIVYNFLIMKIRYMKDKVKRHLNLK